MSNVILDKSVWSGLFVLSFTGLFYLIQYETFEFKQWPLVYNIAYNDFPRDMKQAMCHVGSRTFFFLMLIDSVRPLDKHT